MNQIIRKNGLHSPFDDGENAKARNCHIDDEETTENHQVVPERRYDKLFSKQ